MKKQEKKESNGIKVDFDKPVFDLINDKPFERDSTQSLGKKKILVQESATGAQVLHEVETFKQIPVTIGYICINALLTNFKDESAEAGEKLDRHEMALKIKAGGRQELTTDEAKKLSDLVGKAYGAAISGQICKILQGKGE